MRCMSASDSPSPCSTTATGLPRNGTRVKTSTCLKRTVVIASPRPPASVNLPRNLQHERGRRLEAYRLRSLGVEHQLPPHRLLNRQVARFRATQDPVDIVECDFPQVFEIWSVGKQPASTDVACDIGL